MSVLCRLPLWPALLVFVAFLPAPVAATINVTMQMQLDTDNWYPLPASQMKAAARDAALAEITGTERFRLLDAQSPESARLRGELSLIGPAEVVKLTLRYDPPEGPTLVSTASISIRDMDHQGIFDAFEYVGTRAATGLVDQALARERQPSESEDDSAIGRAFNEAQELKRAGDYESARQALVAVKDMAGPEQQEWVEMAEEELGYGLLQHEARSLMMSLGDMHTALEQKLQTSTLAINRVREAIAANLSHATRIRELQQMLDQLQMTKQALTQAMHHQLVNAVTPYRLTLMEGFAMRGECMAGEKLTEYVHDSSRDVELVETRGDDPADRLYVFESPSSGYRTMLHCHDGEVSLQEYTPETRARAPEPAQ